jgi:hypothetical protein
VLRFTARRWPKNPAGELEHYPALLAALSDVHTGEACGIVNGFLRPDGRDRVRDKKGKTSTGRAGGAAAMLPVSAMSLAGWWSARGSKLA